MNGRSLFPGPSILSHKLTSFCLHLIQGTLRGRSPDACCPFGGAGPLNDSGKLLLPSTPSLASIKMGYTCYNARERCAQPPSLT